MAIRPRGEVVRQLVPVCENNFVRGGIDLGDGHEIAVGESRYVVPPANQEPIAHGNRERLSSSHFKCALPPRDFRFVRSLTPQCLTIDSRKGGRRILSTVKH
jgi:hypothetical protein